MEIDQECEQCNGRGFSLDHHPSCSQDYDGLCDSDECPIQIPCANCEGVGKVKQESA